MWEGRRKDRVRGWGGRRESVLISAVDFKDQNGVSKLVSKFVFLEPTPIYTYIYTIVLYFFFCLFYFIGRMDFGL